MAHQYWPALATIHDGRDQEDKTAQADTKIGNQQQEGKQENQAVDQDSAGRGLGGIIHSYNRLLQKSNSPQKFAQHASPYFRSHHHL
jgi:hypothetical protein